MSTIGCQLAMVLGAFPHIQVDEEIWASIGKMETFDNLSVTLQIEWLEFNLVVAMCQICVIIEYQQHAKFLSRYKSPK